MSGSAYSENSNWTRQTEIGADMRGQLLLLFRLILPASTFLCYVGDILPNDGPLSLDPSPFACVLMFQSGTTCLPNSTASSVRIRAEPSKFAKTGCWMPYEDQVWCYCSEDLCNKQEGSWWLEELSKFETGGKDAKELTKRCAMEHIHELRARSESSTPSSTTPEADLLKTNGCRKWPLLSPFLGLLVVMT